MQLEGRQVESYERDGFLVIDQLIDQNALSRLREAYDQILDREVEAAGDRMLGGITRQVMLPSTSHPDFDRNAALDTGMEIATQLLKAEPARLFDMLIFKPPGHPHDTPWHQDTAYAVKPFAPPGFPNSTDTIQFWVALDDADEENGCMHFLPGYHKEPLLEHYVASGDPEDDGRLLALKDPQKQVNMSNVVVAPVAAGGATLHNSGTPHYTSPNNSADRPRRAYIFNLASPALLERIARAGARVEEH